MFFEIFGPLKLIQELKEENIPIIIKPSKTKSFYCFAKINKYSKNVKYNFYCIVLHVKKMKVMLYVYYTKIMHVSQISRSKTIKEKYVFDQNIFKTKIILENYSQS